MFEQVVRQAPSLELFVCQGIVGRVNAVLQGQVQACRSFSRARYADQYDIRHVVIPAHPAVIIRHGEIRRLDSFHVRIDIAHAVSAPELLHRFFLQFHFQRFQEYVEYVEVQAVGLLEYLP